MKQRIFNAIETLAYHPSGNRGKKSPKVVALLIDSGCSPYEIKLFQQNLLSANFVVILCMLPRYTPFTSGNDDLMSFLNNNAQIVGCICLHPDINSFDLIKRCKNVPSVIFCRDGSMLSRSCVQLKELAWLGANHIRQLGAKHSVFIVLNQQQDPFINQIFQLMSEDSYFQSGNAEISMFSEIVENEREIGERFSLLYSQGVRTFLTNGVCSAQQLLNWAYNQRLRIPDDISIFSIDYNAEAENCIPPLTSLCIPLEKSVELAVKELTCKIENCECKSITLLPVLVDRGSTVRHDETEPDPVD